MTKNRAIHALLAAILTTAGLTTPQPATARVAAVQAPPGDRDGDGSADALDNCLTRPNTSQRDTDADGYGNACDPDFNNDGIVDDRDRTILSSEIDPVARGGAKRHKHKSHPPESAGRSEECGPTSDEEGESATEFRRRRDLDLDEDGRVDANDLEILAAFKGRPPGPRLDTDGDGRADLDDPCPNTARRAAFVFPGCSALDVVERPEALLDPLAAVAGELVGFWRPAPEMVEVVAAIEESAAAMRKASASVRAADPCGGEKVLREALASIDGAARSFPELIARAQAKVPASDGLEDASFEEEQVEVLVSRREDADHLRFETAVVAEAVGRICAGARPGGRFRGKVRRMRDDIGRIELADGRLISIADPATVTGVIVEGVEVEAQGADLGSGNLSAQVVTGDASATEANTMVQCLFLKIVPVQAPPASPASRIDHHPDGYLLNDTYRLERGTGFAVEGAGCNSLPQLGHTVDYFMELVLRRGPHQRWLASHLRPGDAPVTLGAWYDLSWQGTFLQAKVFRRTCQIGGSCNTEMINHTNYPLTVLERGEFCTAVYEETGFDVDDQMDAPLDFRTNRLDFMALYSSHWGSTAHFEAEAFAADGSHQTVTIQGDQPFGVYRDDFFPVTPFQDGLTGMQQKKAAAEATGVEQAAGVKWPRVKGQQNGRSFQYSCRAPKLVRDIVNFCPSVNAYYRLPFAAGLVWLQGQGNFSGTDENGENRSHYNLHAYDMKSGCGANVRAMRAGRVIASISGIDCQNKPLDSGKCSTDPDEPKCGSLCCHPGTCAAIPSQCQGNKIRIRHQDGTIGSYLHLKPGGVFAQVGDVVRRGEVIGLMGTTGASSGVHLHTGARDAASSWTILALFEAVNPWDPSQTLTCYEPQEGHLLLSNNQPF